jgi:hypothetical protein
LESPPRFAPSRRKLRNDLAGIALSATGQECVGTLNRSSSSAIVKIPAHRLEAFEEIATFAESVLHGALHTTEHRGVAVNGASDTNK